MKTEERVRIIGVDCPTCILSIERELRKLGVEMEADPASGYAVVRYEAPSATLRDVARAVREAGYDLEKKSFTVSAEVSEEEVPRFEASVAKLKGIIECRYSPVTEVARIVYNPYSTSEEEILRAITALGFSVGRVNEEARKPPGEEGGGPLLSFVLGLLAVVYHSAEMLGLVPHVDVTLYALLATAVLLLNAKLVYRGFMSLARLSPTMESLVALSSFTAYVFSLYLMAASTGYTTFFEATAGVLGFVSAGKYLEGRLKAQAFEALSEAAELQRGTVRVVNRDGSLREKDVEEVSVGDIVEVKAGERILVDGVVVEGWGYVDESSFTGEPTPSFKTAERRDPVLAGTVLTSGFLRITATRVGRETSLAYILETVREAQFRKPQFQRLADRITGYMTWAVIALSAATFAYWLLAGAGVELAAMFAASVLAVACPCPLGIAVPIVVAVASTIATRFGVLIRGGEVFEKILNVDTVLFDKTGTLTVGSPEVQAVYTFNGFEGSEVLKLAGSAEKRSEHPLARAVLNRCAEAGIDLVDPTDYDHLPGMGVLATVDGAAVAVGSRKLMEELGVELSASVVELVEKLKSSGSSTIFVAVNGQVAGLLEVYDKVKDEAPEVVAYFKGEKLATALATGDNTWSAQRVARELGIDNVFAELRPEDKAELVKQLQSEGRKILFVGDGINDAAAISRAFLGAAVGKGADIAKEAGDVVVTGPSLTSLVYLRELSKAVKRKALENIAWAFTYNFSLVPIAMGALYGTYNFVLKPEVAALAMVLSDIAVVVNAISLRRWRPQKNRGR